MNNHHRITNLQVEGRALRIKSDLQAIGLTRGKTFSHMLSFTAKGVFIGCAY